MDFRIIGAAVCGGAVFLFFFLFLDFSLVLSLGAMGIAFAAGVILLRKPPERSIEMMVHGITDEKLREVLNAGIEKTARLRKLSSRIAKREISQRVDRIIAVVERIYDNFRKDPKDIKTARQFLNYYLDSTITIITKYVELSDAGGASSAVSESLRRTEELLDRIHAAFEAQLDNLLKDDVMNLDNEIELLEKTFKMEGLERK
jgi:5-bromo-4-chloroindolyl phosphate hydrolysis protein